MKTTADAVGSLHIWVSDGQPRVFGAIEIPYQDELVVCFFSASSYNMAPLLPHQIRALFSHFD